MPKRKRRSPAARNPEVLDVQMAAAMLTVSPDTVYDLLKTGHLPGRKVGRKWLTTKSALLRWIEGSTREDALARAIERGDKNAHFQAMKINWA